jgi:hypothetical protein
VRVRNKIPHIAQQRFTPQIAFGLGDVLRGKRPTNVLRFRNTGPLAK